jgi:hypothetical protein
MPENVSGIGGRSKTLTTTRECVGKEASEMMVPFMEYKTCRKMGLDIVN